MGATLRGNHAVRSFSIQALPWVKSFVLGVVQWLWTSFAQLMRLICQDVSKMANDMAKLAEVAEVSGAQVQEVRFL